MGGIAVAIYRLLQNSVFGPEDIQRLATAYEDVGRYDSAIEAYKRSLAIDPLHKDALHDLSIVYLAVGQPDSARNLLPRLMAVDKGWGRELQVLIDRMR